MGEVDIQPVTEEQKLSMYRNATFEDTFLMRPGFEPWTPEIEAAIERARLQPENAEFFGVETAQDTQNASEEA